MNLDIALQKHGEWKMKFRSAISKKENLDAATIAKDNCCDLGLWLHGDGRGKYAALGSFKTCVGKHADFHREAGKVAQLINGQRYAEAEKMLNAGSSYADASNAVGVAILSLKKDAKL